MSVREYYNTRRSEFEWLVVDIGKNFNNYTAVNKKRKVDALVTIVNELIELNKVKTPAEQEEFTNLWTSWQPRISRACERLRIDNLITAEIPEEQIQDDIEIEMQASEYYKIADNILPKEYDGSPDKLQTFIDALELLNGATPANMLTHGVNFVKTRLSGKARDVVTNQATLVAIAQALRTTIKPEPVGQLIDQLMGLKVEGSRAEYVRKVEEVGSKLRRSFITDGASVATADSYAAKHTVQALINNSPTAEARTVLKATSFSTPQEATAKYSALTAETPPSRVGYFRNRPGQYRNKRYNNQNSNGNNYNNYGNERRYYNNNNKRNNWNNRSGSSNNPQNNSTRRAAVISSENYDARQQTPQ